MRLMSMPVYIILMAVIVVLLLSTTYVVNRVRPDDDVAVATLLPTDESITRWANDVLDHGLTPSRLESWLTLLAGDGVTRDPTTIDVRGTSLKLLRTPEGRGWRGRVKTAAGSATGFADIMLSYQRISGTAAIDTSVVPASDSARADAVGYALFVNPPDAQMVKLARRQAGEHVRWESRADGKLSFHVTQPQADRLARLIERLPAL